MIPDIFQIVIIGLMILIPIALIYKKAGFNPMWGALVFLPGFGLLLIFLQLAFIPWPNQKDTSRN
jgi:hypothetical protein